MCLTERAVLAAERLGVAVQKNQSKAVRATDSHSKCLPAGATNANNTERSAVNADEDVQVLDDDAQKSEQLRYDGAVGVLSALAALDGAGAARGLGTGGDGSSGRGGDEGGGEEGGFGEVHCWERGEVGC